METAQSTGGATSSPRIPEPGLIRGTSAMAETFLLPGS